MEFIRVTLMESITAKEGRKIADLKKLEGYLLPVHAIKYILPHAYEPDSYYIYISEAYMPPFEEVEFVPDYAVAKSITKAFFHVLNK